MFYPLKKKHDFSRKILHKSKIVNRTLSGQVHRLSTWKMKLIRKLGKLCAGFFHNVQCCVNRHEITLIIL